MSAAHGLQQSGFGETSVPRGTLLSRRVLGADVVSRWQSQSAPAVPAGAGADCSTWNTAARGGAAGQELGKRVFHVEHCCPGGCWTRCHADRAKSALLSQRVLGSRDVPRGTFDRSAWRTSRRATMFRAADTGAEMFHVEHSAARLGASSCGRDVPRGTVRLGGIPPTIYCFERANQPPPGFQLPARASSASTTPVPDSPCYP